jgi:CRISPR-associated protein Csm3
MESQWPERAMIMFEKLENRALLEYSITTQSDLHIGGHTTIQPAEVDNPVIKNSEGYPIIPGSSLKGVLRTEAEKLLKGLDITICDIFDNKSRGGCNVCPVCLLFGGKELASSIRIKDATAKNKKTFIRDSVAIDRKARKAKNGSKYDIEVVPKRTDFTGMITIENTGISAADCAKLGALLSIVDFFNACNGSIGHAASRGYGQVTIEINKISIVTARDYLEGRYEGTQSQKGTPDYDKLKTSAIKDWSNYLKTSGGHE